MPPKKAPSSQSAEQEPDAAEAFSKRLSELEDRIAALEKALASQLGMTV